MVRHQPLQYYEPQLCLSCLTGIYGCRWKRYQRSHDDTTPVSFAGVESEASKSPVMGQEPRGIRAQLSLCCSAWAHYLSRAQFLPQKNQAIVIPETPGPVERIRRGLSMWV